MTRRQTILALATPALRKFVDVQSPPAQKLKVVCVGGHPDDPESGCGGTLARYSAAGHHLAIIYLTRGCPRAEAFVVHSQGPLPPLPW